MKPLIMEHIRETPIGPSDLKTNCKGHSLIKKDAPGNSEFMN